MNETTPMPTSTPVRYYVGDLCYVMHDEWDEVCDLLFAGGYTNARDGELQLADGRKFVIYGTAYGDGVYCDQKGKAYSVDSGTIGAIKVDDIRDPEFDRIIKNGLGHIHEFLTEISDTNCYIEGGLIVIDTVAIDTDGSYGDDDYFEDDYEGEDPYAGI